MPHLLQSSLLCSQPLQLQLHQWDKPIAASKQSGSESYSLYGAMGGWRATLMYLISAAMQTSPYYKPP